MIAAIATVESRVPTTDSTATASFSRASNLISSKNAPANSRSASIPCKIRLSKLICCTNLVAHGWMPGAYALALTKHNEHATVRSMVPMVIGSLSQRELIQPNRAAIDTRRLRSWSVVIEREAFVQSLLDGCSLASRSHCQYRRRIFCLELQQTARIPPYLLNRLARKVCEIPLYSGIGRAHEGLRHQKEAHAVNPRHSYQRGVVLRHSVANQLRIALPIDEIVSYMRSDLTHLYFRSNMLFRGSLVTSQKIHRQRTITP